MAQQRSLRGVRRRTDEFPATTRKRLGRTALLLVGALATSAALPATDLRSAPLSGQFVPLRVVDDGVPEPLASAPGDSGHGRALIIARDAANCTLCHGISDPAIRFSGNLGPSLDGVGRKFSAAQLRLRVADYLQVSAVTIMPSYYRIDGLDRVAAAYRGKPILTEQEIEDIVAYLASLK